LTTFAESPLTVLVSFFRQAVPVGDHDLATPQLFHAVRGNKLARSIKAQVP